MQEKERKRREREKKEKDKEIERLKCVIKELQESNNKTQRGERSKFTKAESSSSSNYEPPLEVENFAKVKRVASSDSLCEDTHEEETFGQSKDPKGLKRKRKGD